MSYWISQFNEIRVARAERLPDGRKRLVRWVSWKQNAEAQAQLDYTYGSVDPFPSPPTGWGSLLLAKVEADSSPANNGAGNDPVIQLTYEEAGLVNQQDETKNNGKLLIRSLTYFYTTPPTPSGYTLISESKQNEAGWPYRTYTFAKGDGEISRSTNYNQSDDVGTTGVTVLGIQYLTAPSAAEPTWADVSGYVKIAVENAERDGHEIWSATFAKGVGLVSQSINTRQDGLREVTNVALGTRDAPSGVVIADDYRIADGYKIYTVTSMQAADGTTAITSVSLAFERYVPFTYPGRAKAYTTTVSPKVFLDVFLSPPVDTQVKATVTVSYTTTNTLGTISDFWNPTEWATMRATWVGSYGVAACSVQAYKGYRTTSSTPVTVTGSSSPKAIFNNSIYNGEDATITITGGPSDPGGSTWTLSAEIEPAFTSSTGTQYYRKTLVSAAIPSQSALPV